MEMNRCDYLMERRLKELSVDLSKRYRECSVVFEQLLKKFVVVFPKFTDHSLLHSLNVVNYSNLLLKDKVNDLSASEIYVYLMATALHDVGMSVRDADYKEFIKMPQVSEFIETHPEESKMSVSRRFHNDFSAAFIMKYYEQFDIPNERYSYAIAAVAAGHRKKDLFNRDEYPEKYEIVPGDYVRLPILAALLRLADEIDMARNRNPIILYDINSVEDASENDFLEFGKCDAIQRIECNNIDIVIHYRSDDPEIISKIVEYKEGLYEKLQYCMKVINEFSDMNLEYRNVRMVECDS